MVQSLIISPTNALFRVIKILKIEDTSNMVTFGNNLDSGLMGFKAIIKVANRFFEDEEVNKIALVAPHAKLNIIRDYEVVEKRVVEIPERNHRYCFIASIQVVLPMQRIY